MKQRLFKIVQFLVDFAPTVAAERKYCLVMDVFRRARVCCLLNSGEMGVLSFTASFSCCPTAVGEHERVACAEFLRVLGTGTTGGLSVGRKLGNERKCESEPFV